MSDRDPGGEGGFDRDKDRDQEIDKDSGGPRLAPLAGRARRAGRAVHRASTPRPELDARAGARPSGREPGARRSDAQHGGRPVRSRHQGGDARAARHVHGGPAVPHRRPRPRDRRRPQARPGHAGQRRARRRRGPAVEDAVAVAVLWLDEVTALGAPSWRATGFSRAEWVEATMPRWFDLVEPVSDGVTNATSAAIRKQLGDLGPEAFGDALPPELQGMVGAGFDPARCSSSGPRCCRTSAARCSRPSSARPSAPSPPRSWARLRWASRSPSRASSPCCPATSTSSRPRSRSTCHRCASTSRFARRPASGCLRRCRGSVRS